MRTKLLLLLAICFTAFGLNAQVNSVAIVGQGQGGWPGDNPENPADLDTHQMTSTDGEHWTYVGITLINANTGGGIKFRANNAWAISWGSTAFPTGTGTLGGPNIICVGGTYGVTFNSTTGEYHFEGPPIPEVKLVGTAVTTAGGVNFSTLDADNYTATNVTLVGGTAQFQVDNDGSISFSGSNEFPVGEAIDPLGMIPVPAGTYSSISFNLSSGHFEFTAAPVYPAISILGDAVGGWDNSPGNPGPIDINQMTTADGITYTLAKLPVTVGGLKFRKDNAWAEAWGGVAFPVGPTAGEESGNIAVLAGQEGTYDVTFNRTTGAYAFTFPTIAIVGDGAGGWPTGDVGEVDANVLTTTDGVTYTRLGMTLTAGEAKFRQGNSWTVNWGGDVPAPALGTFPTGNGIQGGQNIGTVAGVYDVTLNRITGAYSFALLSTKGFSTSNFKVYPNPTNNNWNFSSVKENIQSIQIVDVLGKTVMTVNPNNTAANVDASALNAGIYFAKIATASANQTIKLMKN